MNTRKWTWLGVAAGIAIGAAGMGLVRAATVKPVAYMVEGLPE